MCPCDLAWTYEIIANLFSKYLCSLLHYIWIARWLMSSWHFHAISHLCPYLCVCIYSIVGLADPWGASNSKEEAEPLPSYDDITGGAIGDPWGASAATAPLGQPQPPTQPVPLVDPWGGFTPSAGAPVPPSGSIIPAQPQANPE